MTLGLYLVKQVCCKFLLCSCVLLKKFFVEYLDTSGWKSSKFVTFYMRLKEKLYRLCDQMVDVVFLVYVDGDPKKNLKTFVRLLI